MDTISHNSKTETCRAAKEQGWQNSTDVFGPTQRLQLKSWKEYIKREHEWVSRIRQTNRYDDVLCALPHWKDLMQACVFLVC